MTTFDFETFLLSLGFLDRAGIFHENLVSRLAVISSETSEKRNSANKYRPVAMATRNWPSILEIWHRLQKGAVPDSVEKRQSTHCRNAIECVTYGAVVGTSYQVAKQFVKLFDKIFVSSVSMAVVQLVSCLARGTTPSDKHRTMDAHGRTTLRIVDRLPNDGRKSPKGEKNGRSLMERA